MATPAQGREGMLADKAGDVLSGARAVNTSVRSCAKVDQVWDMFQL